MPNPIQPRRLLLDQARKFLAERALPDESPPADIDPPRLTLQALEKISMSRSRERIMANLDEMYKDAFERAKASGDQAQMAALDFSYRREQLYFEVLLDVREAMEKR